MTRFVVATALLLTLAYARARDPLRPGLTGTYFPDAAWTATPIAEQIDARPSTDVILDAWNGHPPSSFGATWTGSFLAIRRGAYTFATSSDDGSWVFVDGHLVVDNGGEHAARLRQGTITLDGGVHSIFVKYFQTGGTLARDLLWALDGYSLEPMPDWAFSVRQTGSARLSEP